MGIIAPFFVGFHDSFRFGAKISLLDLKEMRL